MKNKISYGLLLLTLILVVMPFGSAIETYKLNTPIDLKFTCTLNYAIPNSSTIFNFTISYANGSSFISSKLATPQGSGLFNYTTTFTELGTYKVNEFCYSDPYSYSNTEFIDITYNGNPQAQGSIIVLFSILFLMLAGLICFLAVSSIGHLLKLDFDIIDFSMDFGIYIIIFVFYYLETFYVGNQVMDSFLLMIVQFGWMFFIVIPAVALILSLTIGTLNKKQINVRIPKGRFR